MSILHNLFFDAPSQAAIATNWMQCAKEVEDYIKKSNKHPSPRSLDEDESILGIWCTTQKLKWQLLNETQRSVLSNLGVMPTSIQKQTGSSPSWDGIYNQAFLHKSRQGTLPSKGAKAPESISIYKWCKAQRASWSELTEAQQYKLTALGVFPQKKPPEWTERFSEVELHFKNSGGLPSPRSKDKYIKSLGAWCSRQRSSWSKLSEDKRLKLSSIGVIPSAQRTDENDLRRANDSTNNAEVARESGESNQTQIHANR